MKRLFFLLIFFIPFGEGQAQFLETVDSLVLEENGEVLLSDIKAQNISGSDLLVVEKETYQIIVYSEQGALKKYFGRYGRGPGDIENPTSALKLPSGNILVTEFYGRISKFDASGNFMTVKKIDITRLNTLRMLPTGKVLLVGGMGTPENNYLLYLFNPESMRIEKRFFKLPFDPTEYAMQPLTLAEPSHAVVCGDKIAAIHSMLPVIYYFDFDGNLIEEINIDSDLFTKMKKLPTPSNPQNTMKAYGDASWNINLFCVAKNNLLIQFIANLRTSENPLSLMLVNENGALIKESLEVPKVLFSKNGTDTLFIKNEKSGLVNQVIKSRLIRD